MLISFHTTADTTTAQMRAAAAALCSYALYMETTPADGGAPALIPSVELQPAPVQQSEAPKPSKPKKNTPTPAPVAVEAPAAAPAPAAAEVTKPKGITLEEVRAQLTAVSAGGKKAEITALVKSYGVGSLKEIPSEMFEGILKEGDRIMKGEPVQDVIDSRTAL